MGQDSTSFWVEIKKYEETLAKDPGSYCFAPLAELYRKLKLFDDAINVAKKGCEVHPEYVGGYLALGRAYGDKGMKQECKEALEKVVKVTPDNLLAQKMLSQIYLDADDAVSAERTLRTILTLYPDEMESKIMLDSLLRTSRVGVSVISDDVSEHDGDVLYAELTPLEELTSESELVEDEILDDLEIIEELTELETLDEEVEETALQTETVTGDFVNTVEFEVIAQDAIDEDIENADLMPADELIFGDELQPDDLPVPVVKAESIAADNTKMEIAPVHQQAVVEVDPFTFEDVSETVPIVAKKISESDGSQSKQSPEMDSELPMDSGAFHVVGKDPMATVTVAELYIRQGFLKRALKIYRDLVEASPDDEELKQRLISLKHSIDTDESIARDHALDSNYRVAATDEGNVASIHNLAVESLENEINSDGSNILSTLEGWLANIRRRH